MTDEIEIDIIVLPKIYKLKETNKESKLLEWIYFLENPNSEVVKKIMENNEGIKDAKEKLDALQNDEVMKRLLEWEESVSHEEASIRITARNEGYREGKQESQKEIAKKLKQEGITIEIIMKTTGLTKQEIDELK